MVQCTYTIGKPVYGRINFFGYAVTRLQNIDNTWYKPLYPISKYQYLKFNRSANVKRFILIHRRSRRRLVSYFDLPLFLVSFSQLNKYFDRKYGDQHHGRKPHEYINNTLQIKWTVVNRSREINYAGQEFGYCEYCEANAPQT